MASYAGGSRYYKARTAPRYTQQSNDVERGINIGSQIGKMLGGLGEALKGARRDKIANQLMNEASIGDQPGAGVTQSLGKLGDGGDGGGNTQPLGTVAPDQTFTNPSTGNVEGLSQTPGASDDDLRRAIVASQLQSTGPTVGSDGSMIPDMSGGTGPTVGSLVHTGGTQELDLQKEILAMRLSKGEAAAKVAAAQAKAADEAAQAAGTGKYALETATKRAQLAHIQEQIRKSQEPDAVKNPPAVSIGSEPVIDQGQLNRHIDGIYGTGAASSMASSLSSTDPMEAPVITADSVIVSAGPNKKITIPLTEAQTYVKQANALRLKQGLPAYRVPGEDLMIGATAGNPYIAQNNLDVYSRAPGTWIRLPNGKIAQVPNR